MSILRKSMVTVLAAGALLATPSAAFASTAQHAANSTTAASALAKVHRAPCTGLTFNVYHNNLVKPICYAGTGTIRPRIQGVNRITTGEYWGCLRLRVDTALEERGFDPRQIIGFAGPVELVSVKLAHHLVTCPL